MSRTPQKLSTFLLTVSATAVALCLSAVVGASDVSANEQFAITVSATGTVLSVAAPTTTGIYFHEQLVKVNDFDLVNDSVQCFPGIGGSGSANGFQPTGFFASNYFSKGLGASTTGWADCTQPGYYYSVFKKTTAPFNKYYAQFYYNGTEIEVSPVLIEQSVNTSYTTRFTSVQVTGGGTSPSYTNESSPPGDWTVELTGNNPYTLTYEINDSIMGGYIGLYSYDVDGADSKFFATCSGTLVEDIGPDELCYQPNTGIGTYKFTFTINKG